MRFMFLLPSLSSQVTGTSSFVKFFASEEEDLPKALAKKHKKIRIYAPQQKIFASRLRVVSFFEKTEWKNARPGGARHLVLCNNFARTSQLSAFVKFYSKKLSSSRRFV